jgi:hypothetical protein
MHVTFMSTPADPLWFNRELLQLKESILMRGVAPLPQQSFGLQAVQQAFRVLQLGTNVGKVVVLTSNTPLPESTLPATSLVECERWQRGPDPGTLVRLCRDESVVLFELNDPQRFNTLSWAMGDDMRQAVKYLQAQRGTMRAVVLRGAGKVFCAGGNPYGSDGPVLTDIVLDTIRSVVGIGGLHVPTVCALQGSMIGGAAAIFLHTDLRISDAAATFQHGKACP